MFLIFSRQKYWPHSRTVKISNLKEKKTSFHCCYYLCTKKMSACSLWSHVCNMEGTKSAIARLKVLKSVDFNKPKQIKDQPTNKVLSRVLIIFFNWHFSKNLKYLYELLLVDFLFPWNIFHKPLCSFGEFSVTFCLFYRVTSFDFHI